MSTFCITHAIDLGDVTITQALERMHTHGLTKYGATQEKEFRGEDSISRGEAAKFYAQFGKVINLPQIKSDEDCQFTDIGSYDYTLVPNIVYACSLGLVKGSQGKYMPTKPITEAEALTILIRAVHGKQNESYTPRYQGYYIKGQQMGLIAGETLNSLGRDAITRKKLGRWLYKIGSETQESMESGTYATNTTLLEAQEKIDEKKDFQDKDKEGYTVLESIDDENYECLITLRRMGSIYGSNYASRPREENCTPHSFKLVENNEGERALVEVQNQNKDFAANPRRSYLSEIPSKGIVVLQDNKFGYINSDGEIVIKPEHQSLRVSTIEGSEHFIVIFQEIGEGLYTDSGVINTSLGKVIIEPSPKYWVGHSDNTDTITVVWREERNGSKVAAKKATHDLEGKKLSETDL